MEKITFEGLEYGVVESKTGRLWLDRNLGAMKVATDYDDEQAYGNYFTFNEIKCPDGFRLPTKEEWEEEVSTWDSKNMTGALNSKLRLPCAGFKTYNNRLYERGDLGNYWSSTEYGSDYAWLLYFRSGYAYTYYYYRRNGLSVRCIKDE
jgi:uncharacterized protein (TIGR02145 family)